MTDRTGGAPRQPRVVLATRLDPPGDTTARAAIRLATQIEGELIVAYVAEEIETVPRIVATTGTDEDSVRAEILEEVERRVTEFVRVSGAPAGTRVRIGAGRVAREVTRVAREERADYLVLGTMAHGVLHELVVGSTTHEILRHAPCPVLVVPLRREA